MTNQTRITVLALTLLSTALAEAETTPPSNETRVVAAGSAATAQVLPVSAPFLAPLKALPVLGRDFMPADFKQDAPPVAIISQDLWAQAYNRQLNIIGTKVRFGEREATIIAVAPPKPSELAGRKIWLASAN